MTRRILFQIHWFLGITAGLVLAVMGVTGAMISFSPEIIAAINPGIVTVTPQPGPRLSAPDLVARFQAQRPDARIGRLVVERDPTRAAMASYTTGASKTRHVTYLDPVTGRVLGAPRGEAVLDTVENLHRWLALPGGGKGIGRQITGFSALALIFSRCPACICAGRAARSTGATGSCSTCGAPGATCIARCTPWSGDGCCCST